MMTRSGLLLGGSATLLVSGANAAAQRDDQALVTGVTNIGPGLLLLAIATGLILTLILRPTVTQLVTTLVKVIGQRRVTRVLLSKSPDVLDNFILPGAYGGLTRVDHAILVGGGIICIQTRHCSSAVRGTVMGAPNDPQWTLSTAGQQRRFLNPKIQNEGRAAALRKVVPDVPVIGLVVFTGNVELTAMRSKSVIHLNELEKTIDSIAFHSAKSVDWDSVWLTIKSAALTDDESRKDFDAQLSFG